MIKEETQFANCNLKRVENRVKNVLHDLPSSDETIKALIESDFQQALEKVGVGELASWIVQYLQPGDSDMTKVISLVGGCAAGKTTFCKKLESAFNDRAIFEQWNLPGAITLGFDISLIKDRRYRREHIVKMGRSPLLKHDFEWFERLVEKIRELKPGESLMIPEHDYKTGMAKDRPDYTHEVSRPKVIIVEGDHRLPNADITIYFHVPDKRRNMNRLARELRVVDESGLEGILDNMRIRHERQQLVYTLPAANKAQLIIIASLVQSKNGSDYQYSLYERKGVDKL